MMTSLGVSEREAALETLPNWHYSAARRALHRTLTFGDFAEALSAMVRIGMAADKADHHPEWCNIFNRVDIWLTTHEVDDVSTRDIALAATIDSLFV
ncbi:4a-hydroxytetrahydrobiopterin dehydratase [Sphingomonas montana]|uniref:4a-hydroxytetrahydrobiopterin dehydratase n=1 Tax=Sphingomonas montana TaxID=1843236 RepID=UPI00096C7D7C|nr:4a-hydroxytetrahydrobiopterin dehydratase [Sphingomonas montana]